MHDDAKEPDPIQTNLGRAVEPWEGQGDLAALERWLTVELDDAGAPVRLPLEEWPTAIERIARARLARPGWTANVEERATDFVRMLMRFTRPDGRQAVTAGDWKPRAFWKRIASAFPAPDVERVLSWWFPSYEAEPAPPPLPAWSSPDRVLGVLRADWTPRGDFLVFDQRNPTLGTRFELFGAGVPWLGPLWSAPTPLGSQTTPEAATPTAWGTNSSADVAEWTFSIGGRRVTRLALMLRGRRLALLADQVDGAAPGETWQSRVDIHDGLAVEPLADGNGMAVRRRPSGKPLQLVPIGGGRFDVDAERRQVHLVQTAARSMVWLPMVASWDSARGRKPPVWKPLTVAENGKACPSDVAWAARMSWSRDESFVIYRSFGPAVRRSFLGCTTTARFLVGRFATPEGDVEPIVTLA